MITSSLMLLQLFFFPEIAWSQVELTPGGRITQNFDNLGTATIATLPLHWKADRWTSARKVGSYFDAADTTTHRAGNNMPYNASQGIYNFGAGNATTATERAIGFLAGSSGTVSGNLYVSVKNTSNTTITSLALSYDVEKYRRGSNFSGFSITLYYSKNGKNWTPAGPDFVVSFPPDANRIGYANAPGAVKSINNLYLILPNTHAIAPDEVIYLAWNYSLTLSSGSANSNSQALGIDNVVIAAPLENNNSISQPVVPGTFTIESCGATAGGSTSFTPEGTYGTTNQFLVQLSNSTGQFIDPVIIGKGTQSPIAITIPAATPSGNGYKIRVYSTDPFSVSEPSERITINTPSMSCVSASNHFFRSIKSGLWHAIDTWESSADNITWIPATLYPEYRANDVVITSGHSVIMGADLVINELVIQGNATLTRSGGAFTLNNDASGHDMIIEGSYIYQGGSSTTYNSGSTVLVSTGGKVEVRSNEVEPNTFGGSALLPIHQCTNVAYLYETESVFSWNVPGATINTGSTEIFPNANTAVNPSVIPMLLIHGNTTLSNGENPVIINGLTRIEEGGTLTLTNSGPKTFRNGIVGDGSILQELGSGDFLITGENAQLGGRGEIRLGHSGLKITQGSNVQLISNKIINSDVGGVFSVVEGILNTQTFSLEGTAVFNLSNQGVLRTANPAGVAESIRTVNNNLFAPSASYEFNSATEQSTGFPPNVLSVGTLKVNSSRLILSESISLTGNLDLMKGKLFTTSNEILTMEQGAQVSNASGNRYVDGPMIKVGSEDFIFPIGSGGVYAPIGIISPGDESTRLLAAYHPSSSPDPEKLEQGLMRVSEVEHWIINSIPTGQLSQSARVTLYWGNGSRSGINEPQSLRVAHYNGEYWENKGGELSGNSTSSSGSITTTIQFTQNGPITFAASNENNPLPVTLLSFSGKYQQGKVLLAWSTATEVNNLGFEVEKSINGESFYRIGFVEGSGSSTVQKSYSFADHDFQYEAYYRLRQVDIDGQFEYSDVVYVREQNLGGQAFQLYPNPAHEQVRLVSECCSSTQQELVMKLVGSDGRVLGTVTGTLKEINMYLNQHLSTYPAGIYHLHLQTSTDSAVLKLVKN